jgi:hypothetical protein
LLEFGRTNPAGLINEGSSLHNDEKGKIPLGRRECLPLVVGSEFDGYRLSQNPGVGQKVRLDRNILGPEQNRREGRK